MYNPQLTVARISEARKNKGITLQQLNDECELNKNTIAKSSESKTGLSAKILYVIATYLECSVDYLLGITDNPDVMPEAYISGDNNIQAVKNSSVTVNHTTSDISSEFMAIFEQLDFPDKVKVMNFVLELKNQ